jgi:hypothetical protein
MYNYISQCVQSYAEHFTKMKFKDAQELSTMSVRQLQRLLRSEGENPDVIAKLLDKQELKALAEAYINQHNGMIVGYCALCVLAAGLVFALIIRSRYIFLWICDYFNMWLYSYIDPSIMLLPSIKYAFRKRLFLGLLCLLLCCACDIYQAYVQVSILLSWILPNYSILRKFLAPTLYFPLSPSLLTAKIPSSASFNFGPMITLWISRYVKSLFETWGSKIILSYKQRKSKKET